MEILTLEELQEYNGGVDWGKVGMGALQTASGVIGAGLSSWTGGGAIIGGVVAIDGVGVMVSGFESK